MKNLTRTTKVSDGYACRMVLRYFRRYFQGKTIKIYKDTRDKHTRVVVIYGVRYYEWKSTRADADKLLKNLPIIKRTKLFFYPQMESYRETKKWHPEYLGLPPLKK